jgi:hypothetical protein
LSGGTADAAGFTVQSGGSSVLGFSITGGTIPAGAGVLTQVEFDPLANEVICMDEVGGVNPDTLSNSDLNSDGTSNMLDLVLLSNCILASNCNSGDSNGDGGFNIVDVVLLSNWVINYSGELPLIFASASGKSLNIEYTCTVPLITVSDFHPPTGGYNWDVGSTGMITWSSSNLLSTSDVSIKLYKSGSFLANISTSEVNDGIFAWTIPYTLSGGSDYKIRIASVTDPTVYDECIWNCPSKNTIIHFACTNIS